MIAHSNMGRVWLAGMILIVTTVTCFWPVLKNDFINYDDPDYVTANEAVKSGLTWDGVKWAFSTRDASNWHPLTWLSHMLDVSWYGLRPVGHHATSLLIHVTNSLLVLLLFRYMTGSVWRSSTVAALFAVHPLHVESVAWVAERKDLLSAFFGILTLMAYTRRSQCKAQKADCINDRRLWYGVTVLLFALGLMCKPMLVTWPFVMLLLDFWPLQRLDRLTPENRRATLKRLVMEKLPFLALATASCAVTVIVQSEAVAKTEIVPIFDRLGNALVSYVAYLGQMFWPARLAVFYPFPLDLTAGQIVAAGAMVLAISVAALCRWRTQPFAITGWFWYLGSLVPVIGLVQVGSQARADRYTYLPLIGIFVVVAWGLCALVQARPQWRRVIITATVLGLAALSVTTYRQAGRWRDSRTLFAHAAQVTQGNYIALSGVGIADAQEGNWASAMTNLTRALEFARPHHAERRFNYYLGVILQLQGKPLEALPVLEDAVVSSGLRPERDFRLGLSLIEANRLTEAETALQAALAARPQSVEYQLAMAALYVRQGSLAKAEPLYQAALASHPDSPVARKSFGDFLMMAGRPAEAEPHHAAAVKVNPTDVRARRAYAATLQKLGKLGEAVAQLEAAVNSGQADAETAAELAELYDEQGQSAKAVAWYGKALAAEPKSISALNNLAWILATDPDGAVRNGARAVELAERACGLTEWKAAVIMGTLAAAYAEAGRFADAVAMAGKARDQARSDKQELIAKQNDELRKLYEREQPYRDR